MSNSLFTKNFIELENNTNTQKRRRYFFSMFSFMAPMNTRIKTTFDENFENDAKTRGGKVESLFHLKNFLLKTYVEAREYRTDSTVCNPGYGLISRYNFLISNITNYLHGEYKRFGKYHNEVAEYSLRPMKKVSLDYSFMASVKKQSIPYGLFSQDRRTYAQTNGSLFYKKEEGKVSLSLNFKHVRSEKVASMNFENFQGEVGWHYMPYNKIDLLGHAKYISKHFLEGGSERIRDYGASFNMGMGYVSTLMGIWMKRFDYTGLAPLDRDERSIVFNILVGSYNLSFEDIDVNYIRTPYVSNSRRMRKFMISGKERVYCIPNFRLEYQGNLFASIFTPIYTDKRGFYERYWENNFYAMAKDSVFWMRFSIKYKEVSEFKQDSLYSPEDDIEYMPEMSIRFFSKRHVRGFINQYASISQKNGIREWRLGAKINTTRYELEFGTGEIYGKKNIYMEFSGWI